MQPQDSNSDTLSEARKVIMKEANEKKVPRRHLYKLDGNPSTHSDCTELTASSSFTDNSTFACMTVEGIYTRGPVPRRHELPDDYGLTHVKPDQVFCRRRMYTPFEKDASSEKAMFVPEQGLVGPMFYHADLEEHDESDDEDEGEEDEEPRIYEERAVLFQAIEHYEQLMEEPKLSKYFQEESVKSPKRENESAAAQEQVQTKPDIEAIINKPRFGEQIVVQGMDAQQIAIGDVFEIEGGLSPLKVEITSPRLCCAWVDKRNGSPFGLTGVKRYCNKNGLGGFFARVLVKGELRDGMKLVRTAHPHPKWTLQEISYALYGEGPKMYLMASWAHWQRSKQELMELCQLKQLGDFEWKEEAEYIIQYWDHYRPEDKLAREAAARASLLGRLGLYDLVHSKLVTNLWHHMTDCKCASPQDYIIHILVALVACITIIFVLSTASKTPNLT